MILIPHQFPGSFKATILERSKDISTHNTIIVLNETENNNGTKITGNAERLTRHFGITAYFTFYVAPYKHGIAITNAMEAQPSIFSGCW